MGTTSPDNIYYADDSTAYDVPAVMAAMANSVQTALTNGPGWASFSAAPWGVSVGNGTLSQRWRKKGGTVEVEGTLTLGSSTTVTNIVVYHPVEATGLPSQEGFPLGVVTFFDVGNTYYSGAVISTGPATAQLYPWNTASTYAVFAAVPSTTPGVPFAMAPGDKVLWRYSYSV